MAGGSLFSVSTSGSQIAFPVNFELCLNAKKPVSCQVFTTNQFNANIQTTIPKHTYTLAGIKVQHPYITISGIGTACQMLSNGYCVFPVSDSLPKTINLLYSTTMQITPATLPNATLSSSYYSKFLVQNGVAPYSYTISSGSLPNGLMLNSSTGVLSGTPTAPGPFSFTLKITDSATPQKSIYQDYFIYVANNQALFFYPSSPLPNATLGQNYSKTIYASPASGPVTFSTYTASTGLSLPPGLNLSSSGVLSGTPTQTGSYNFVVTASTTNQTNATEYNLVVSGPSVQLQPTELPVLYLNQESTLLFSAQGGTAPYTFTYSGTIPFSMSLSSNGVLSGIPFFAGNFPITVTATDANGSTGTLNYNLLVDGNLSLSPNQLPPASVGINYSQYVIAGSGTAPYTYIISSKNPLPPNLNLTSTTGEISGFPKQPGTYLFSITAYDSNGLMTTQNYYLQVNGEITIYPNNLPGGSRNNGYSQTLQAGGGAPPYTFSLYSGTLPYGLQISSNGTISGTPTTDGTYSFVIDVIDSLNNHATQAYKIGITGALSISPNSPLQSGTLNTNYSVQLSASGGVSPYSYAVTSGKLPRGLSLDKSTGLISGTPSDNDIYNFSISVTDANGNKGTQTYQLTITGSLTLTPTPPLPNAIIGTNYSAIIRVNGTTNPCVFKIISSNGLPVGCSLITASNGLSTTISCPNGPSYVGSYPFTLQAYDATNNATGLQSYTLNANGSLTMTPSTLPSGNIKTPYTIASNPATLTVQGTSSATFSVTGQGQYLPPGLSLIADPNNLTQATIQGTPTTSGTYPFSITATYISGNNTYTVTNNYSISIGDTLNIVPPSSKLNSATFGTTYSQTFKATDGYSPYIYSQSGGELPNGLALSSNGVLSGTPNAVGTFHFSIKATDSYGNTVIGDYSLSVNGSLRISPTTLVTGTAATAYSQNFTATNGTSPYTFTVSQGNLPPGLTLNSSGTLSGTPSVSGSYYFTIEVTDNNGNFGTEAYSLNISPSLIYIPKFGRDGYICNIATNGDLDPNQCQGIAVLDNSIAIVRTDQFQFILVANLPSTEGTTISFCNYNATGLGLDCVTQISISAGVGNTNLVFSNNYIYELQRQTSYSGYYQIYFCPVSHTGINVNACEATGPTSNDPFFFTIYNNYAYIIYLSGVIKKCPVSNLGIISDTCSTQQGTAGYAPLTITNNTLYIQTQTIKTCPISSITGDVGTCSTSGVSGQGYTNILGVNKFIYQTPDGQTSNYINYCNTALSSCQNTGTNLSGFYTSAIAAL